MTPSRVVARICSPSSLFNVAHILLSLRIFKSCHRCLHLPEPEFRIKTFFSWHGMQQHVIRSRMLNQISHYFLTQPFILILRQDDNIENCGVANTVGDSTPCTNQFLIQPRKTSYSTVSEHLSKDCRIAVTKRRSLKNQNQSVPIDLRRVRCQGDFHLFGPTPKSRNALWKRRANAG